MALIFLWKTTQSSYVLLERAGDVSSALFFMVYSGGIELLGMSMPAKVLAGSFVSKPFLRLRKKDVNDLQNYDSAINLLWMLPSCHPESKKNLLRNKMTAIKVGRAHDSRC